MAREISEAAWCDWHRKLREPERIQATHLRITPRGKEIDLCESCAMRWDLLIPRIKETLAFLHPEVLEALFNTGNPPAEDRRDRVPAQLAITEEPTPTPAPAAAKKAAPKPSASNGRSGKPGRWIEGEPQVRCPLSHPGANSPAEFWVKVPDRGSHAASSHKIKPQEIAWVLPTDGSVALPHICREHKLCAAHDNGAGFGFPTKSALSTHSFKAKQANWELADTDAAETATAPAA